jgi:hypothetical protein
MGKIRIRDGHPRLFFRGLRNSFFGLKILTCKFFDADSDPGSGIFLTWIQDPGWKNSDPGSGIKIQDPQHCTIKY